MGRNHPPLRVFLDTPRGVWRGENLGDVAMCRAAIRRCAAAKAGCLIAVVIDNPLLLGSDARGIVEVPSVEREHWLGNPSDVRARRFDCAFAAADVVATTGHGALVDLIARSSIDHLQVLARARRRGALTAVLGHGIGPIGDPELRAMASEVLPGVDLICVRERVLALPLLAQLGVPMERVVVTGDDALEIAVPREGLANGRGQHLGLSVRMSGIDRGQAQAIASAARAVAKGHGLSLVPLPIDHSDPQALLEQGLPCELPPSIDSLLEAAGSCAAIVGGSYHACVFGLAQGVPVVAVAATDFYRGKMAGLATWFPSGCEVVDAGREDLGELVRAGLEVALKRSDEERAALVSSAWSQAQAGRTALKGLLKRGRFRLVGPDRARS